MKDTWAKCGYIVTDDKELSEVFGFTNSNGYTSLYYNNDPYGLVVIEGFQNIEVEDMGTSEALLVEMVQKGERGAREGVIMLKDKLMVIKSVSDFEAELQPLKLGEGEIEPIDYYVDFADCDPDCSEFATVAELFNLW